MPTSGYARALTAAKPKTGRRKGKPDLTGRALALTRGKGKKIGLRRQTTPTSAQTLPTIKAGTKLGVTGGIQGGFPIAADSGLRPMPKGNILPIGTTEADGGFRTFPKPVAGSSAGIQKGPRPSFSPTVKRR